MGPGHRQNGGRRQERHLDAAGAQLMGTSVGRADLAGWGWCGGVFGELVGTRWGRWGLGRAGGDCGDQGGEGSSRRTWCFHGSWRCCNWWWCAGIVGAGVGVGWGCSGMAFVYVAPRSHTPGRCAPPGAKLVPALVPCYFLLFRGAIRSVFGTRTGPPTNCISSVPPPQAGAGGGSSSRGAF